MRFNDAARVGFTVLLGIAVLVAATFWIRGWKGETYTRKVAFTNAQGLQEGAYVRVRGVDLGNVEKIRLDPATGKAIVTMRLGEEYVVKPGDSIRIVTGLTGFTPPYIEITPRDPTLSTTAPAFAVDEDIILPGESGMDTERLVSKTEKLVDNLTTLSAQLNRVATNFVEVAEDRELRNNLKQTARNFARISDRGVTIARNMEDATAQASRLFNRFQGTADDLSRTLARTDALLAGFRGATRETQGFVREARGMVAETRQVVKGSAALLDSTGELVRNTGGLVTETRTFVTLNRPQLQQIVTSLNSAARNLDATLMEAKDFFGDPELRGDFEATARNVREATENLKLITQDVRGLTGDPKVQEDLRATISGLRDVTQQAATVFDRLRTVFGTGGKTAKTVGQRVAEAEVDALLSRTVREGRTRLDLNATIPWSTNTYYRLGFYDFGETNRFNIQLGHRLRGNIWTRYGIYASKLGFGLDVGNRQRPSVTLNAFGIDRPQVDLYGNVPISRHLDLTAGFDDITHRPDPLIGIRYRR